jgi:hypothetical protein
MPRIGDKNTQATINRIKADGHISANETKSLSKAILRDLAKADNAPELMKKIGENLDKLAQALEAGDIKSASNDDAEYNIRDLASELEDAIDGMDDLGVGSQFWAALGIAQIDDYISVGEMDGIKDVANSMLEGASDKAEMAAAIKGLLSLFNANLETDDTPINDVMAPSTHKRFEKMGLSLTKTIAKHLDDPGDMKINEKGLFAQGLVEMDPFALQTIFPMIIQAELSAYDSTGLSGNAKFKMEEAQQKLGQAMLKYIDEAPNMRAREEIMLTAFPFITGSMFPADQKAEWMSMMQGQDTDDLESAVEDMQGMAVGYEARSGVAYQNKAKALRQGVELISAELTRRGGAVPGAPPPLTPASGMSFALGIDLTPNLKDEVQAEFQEVSRSVAYIKAERRQDPSIPEPHFMEVYHDVIGKLFMGTGDTAIIEDGGLKKPKAETGEEILEVGLALNTLEQLGGNDALVKLLRDSVSDQLTGPDFDAEDVMFLAASKLGMAP